MRADRLISLLMLLQTRGQMTATELAERLEVSTRTIYRDLDALSAAGVPVYAERGPQGGCRLLESYRTNLTGLKENEVRALFMLTVPGLLADLGVDQDVEAALLKLTAAIPAPFQRDAERVRQRIHLDPAGWFQMAEPLPYLSLLQQAVWEDRRVRVDYRRADGGRVQRVLEPYGLVAKAGIWYVVGRSFQWTQTFRVSRVQSAELLETTFERPEDFDLATYWQEWCARFEQDLARVEVTLAVAPAGRRLLVQCFGEGIYHLLLQAPPEETSTGEKTGRVLLQLTFDSLEVACRQLLPLVPAVEVQQPDELRVVLAQKAREIYEYYHGQATPPA